MPNVGINSQFITFTHVTMESEKYVCVRETGGNNSVVIIDMANPMQPLRRPITADSALINPNSKVIALKAAIPNTTQDHLQIFNIDAKAKIKSFQMPEQVVFWKWITPGMIGIVTAGAVYHWGMDGASDPVKVFDRTANLEGNQIINYRCSPDMKWLVLVGITAGSPERPQLVKGNMQLFSVEQKRSQALEAHAAAFGQVNGTNVITFSTKTVANGALTSKLHIVPLGGTGFTKKQADLFFPQEFADDFPVSMQVSEKYGLIYVITKLGLLFVYDLETATAVYRNRISPDPVFLTASSEATGGFYAINRRGQVLLATVNDQTIVPFISGQLNNAELAMSIAKRANLAGAGDLVFRQFDQLFAQGNYKGAAELAAQSPQGALRTPETIAKFQQVPVQPGQTSPLLQYFGTLLTKGGLNAIESVELAKLVISQNKKQLLDNWMGENKLECSEELGDLLAQSDQDMALKVYVKAQASPKVVMMLAQKKEYEKIAKYSQQVGYTPDWLQLMMQMLMHDGQGAVNLALMIVQQDPPGLDLNTITDLFLQRNMIREATSFLLDVLKPNLPEHAMLQTKVLEINLITFPNVADAILGNGMFTHYDRPRIAQLCEKAGLYLRALSHYTDLPDIKRCVVNTNAIEPQALTEFFGTLSREWALDCLKELLTLNLRQNLQLAVQIMKEYTEQLTAESCIELLESFNSYEGLYFYLGSYIAFSEDKDVHYKYIEAAAKTGQIKEVERVTRESNNFEPEPVKQFLMEAKLPDARPLINVCDRYGFVHDLTTYLYDNSMLRYIEGYCQKVNPSNTPEVVGALLDKECDEDFIKNLIVSVRSLIPVEKLCEEVEKRNKVKILSAFLEHLVNEGSTDVHVHNALGKIIVDSNNNPDHFLTTNPYYDSVVVGKYCEKRDPNLACVAYKRGQCDMELVAVTNKHSLFKLQARYITERMDLELWEQVLDEGNEFRRHLIDQVVSTALPEAKNPEQVSVTVKAFINADLPNELIELLEKIVLQNSAFSGNPNLQNLLILTAIKADKTRVMDYVNRMDNFDGAAVGDIAVGSELYDEAYAIYKKFKLHSQAISVLIDNLQDFERAQDFASKVEEPEVWAVLARAMLNTGDVAGAISGFLKAGDSTDNAAVIEAAEAAGEYEALVKYLQMTRKKVKEARVDSALCYAFAKTGALGELEEFLTVPNSADISACGDKCYDEGLYEAAKVLFTNVSNWARLASTLVKLGQYQAAVDAARKANSMRTWKEVCFECVLRDETRLAQVAGLNIIVHADELDEVSEFYQRKGKFDQLQALLEAGLGLERAHMGIFTELGIMYARFAPEKLMEHIKLYATRVNIPRLIRTCDEQQHWKELAFLYCQYDEYDNAAVTIMTHSPDAWEHSTFKDVLVKVANMELYYRAINFYLDEQPQLVNELLAVLSSRVDHSRVVDLLRRAGQLSLARPYLEQAQQANLAAVNEAVNQLCVDEEDYEALRASIDTYDNFDAVALAVSIEKHELLEFRRVAATLYKNNKRYRKSMELSKEDKLYKDAMETAAMSGEHELVQELMHFFVDNQMKECFAACLYTCYDLVKVDVALELAWLNGMMEFVMPYLIQSIRHYTGLVDKLEQARLDAVAEEANKKAAEKQEEQQANMYQQLLPPALPAPEMPNGQQGYPGQPGFGGPGGY